MKKITDFFIKCLACPYFVWCAIWKRVETVAGKLWECFTDNKGNGSVGRFALLLGMFWMIRTATNAMDTVGEMSIAEAVVRVSPGLIGFAAYVFSKLYDVRGEIEEIVQRWKNGGKAES